MNNLYIIGLIIGSVVFVVPCFVTLFFYIFNIKLNEIKITYLYAFITGLLLILAIFGFINEAYSLLDTHYKSINVPPDNSIILAVILSGAILGVLFGIFTKWIYFYKTKKNKLIATVNNSNSSLKKIKFHDKLISFIFLFIHNSIDGIILGFLISNNQTELLEGSNLGLLIAFILHLIPTTICIYYINLFKTKNKKISFLFAISSNLVIIPFIFIGIAITHYASSVFWLFPFLLSSTCGSLIFVSIIDFAPEFIHKYNLLSKEWFLVVVFVTIGILVGLILSLVQI